ncbi:LacI family DNA-binding transcriptional regulator [Herbiconiux liangxiaofengii]|uniref:LacI family DNA-binding transcriptional regulator n=1 Tax=Herbiconiux liangxiaofengii TaxID=3342795 RepID=UPI0035B89696
MFVTSQDVADRAGVSRGAVSQILNGRGERFSATTRERVHRAAAELEYQPSAAGRALALGSSDFVIALIPNTTFGGNLQDLFDRATDELAARGLTLVLRLSTPSSTALDRLVSGMKPRAVLSLTPFSPEQRALLDRRGIRAIDPAFTERDTLNEQIGTLQARHLIDRGHTRLAFARLQDARQDPFGDGRETGVREECRRAGLPEPLSIRLDIDLDQAVGALTQLGGSRTGIACYNDDVATALLSAARLEGLRVPDDVALVGMDHTPLGQVTLPRLTTVAYDSDAPAQNFIAAMLATLTDDASDPPVPADIRLRLVPGDTA